MDPAATNPSSLSATVHRDAKLRQHQHEHKHKRQPRILFVLFLSTLFFLLELIVGEMTGSVALVADSFHMISDVLALVISLYGIRFAKQSGPNKKSTYGWQRAEQLGVLVNGVFLLALIFTIIVEAIQRLFSPQEIKNPVLVLIVGGVGLSFNVFGMLIFGHGGGHSHDHNDGSPQPESELEKSKKTQQASSHGHSHADSNMRALFLHVLGDAFGSIGVIASALIIWLTPYSWRFYFDPLISIFMSAIMLSSVIPLVKGVSVLLLQGIPYGVEVSAISEELRGIAGVVDVHELHVWQLRSDKNIAFAHLKFEHFGDYLAQASHIKELFHKYNIHSTTIQPEFLVDPDGGVVMSTPKSPGVLSSLFSKPAKYQPVDTMDNAAAVELESWTGAAIVPFPALNTENPVGCSLACASDCVEPQCCDHTKK